MFCWIRSKNLFEICFRQLFWELPRYSENTIEIWKLALKIYKTAPTVFLMSFSNVYESFAGNPFSTIRIVMFFLVPSEILFHSAGT